MTKLEPGILHQGDYLTLELLPDRNLKFSLTEDGGELLAEKECWHDLMEDVLCNSEFEWMAPEEVGAMTEADILGWQVPRYDNGNIEQGKEFRLWSNINYYQVCSNEELLLRNGHALFTKAY